MRVVRTVVGVLLLVLALPLLLGGAGLWALMQHRSADGAFTARLDRITTRGYAVVAPDLDALLRRGAEFARGGQTRLQIHASTETGPAFIGIAPSVDVARYLSDVPYTKLDEVRLARGPLPVRTSTVAGTAKPSTSPAEQAFWRYVGNTADGTLTLTSSEVRGQQFALVVMAPDARSPISVDLTAGLSPKWLNSSTWGLLILGTVALLLGIAVLIWPTRPREIVYVVDPSQLPDIAARLGAPMFAAAPVSPAPQVSAAAQATVQADAPESALPDPVPPVAGGSAALSVPVPASTSASVPGSTRPETLNEPAAGRPQWPSNSPPPATPILTWPPVRGERSAPPITPMPLPAPAANSGSDPESEPVAEPSSASALGRIALRRAVPQLDQKIPPHVKVPAEPLSPVNSASQVDPEPPADVTSPVDAKSPVGGEPSPVDKEAGGPEAVGMKASPGGTTPDDLEAVGVEASAVGMEAEPAMSAPPGSTAQSAAG